MKAFDYDLDFTTTDFREHPELYRIGKGEQGVLLVEPYKGEILPFWRFRTPDIARKSSEYIYRLFCNYRDADDFVGMDMARKFLQMGYTRARRYANHPSGRKYKTNPQKIEDPTASQEARSAILPQATDWKDSEKAQSAQIFYDVYLIAKADPVYLEAARRHREQYEEEGRG